ncbi:MAG: zinc-dependent metalloprotease [Oscillospiraceae bacterium]|nr:zinc-dependent metalloprotease [Oscillospiraceae bacterium]
MKKVFHLHAMNRLKMLALSLSLVFCVILITASSETALSSSRSTRSVHILYDSTTPAGLLANMNTMFTSSVQAFDNTFGLNFTVAGISQTSLLNGGSCPHSNINQPCVHSNFYCGSYCNGNHHKSDSRLLDRLPNNYPAHTLGVVGHYLCYQEGLHYQSGGMALGIYERNALITNEWPSPLNYLVQHELSHNLGAPDHGGLVDCVMRNGNPYVTSVWCPSCSLIIQRNI